MPDVIDKPTIGNEEDDAIKKMAEIIDKKPEKEDDDKKEKEDESIEKSDDEKEDEEEELIKEDESELEEKEVDLEPEVNARGIDFKKIKEKYGDFAKTNEFRELRNSFYRESKFSELFPTIEDAAEAAENHETFIKLNSELIDKGSSAGLLTAIKEASPDALKKVSASFLDDLNKVEPQLYVQAITPVIKNLAKRMYADSKRMLARNAESDEGKALAATAKNLAYWAFDDPDIVEKEDQVPQRNSEMEKKEKELAEREAKIANERFESAARTAKTNLDRHLDKQILEGLNIDNEFLRNSLLEKIKDEVEKQVSSDNAHMKRMQSLWKRAEQEGYDNKSLSRIISAYLERARPIIPIVRNKLRNVALGKKSAEKNDDVRLPRGNSGRAPSGDGKINMKLVDPKKVDYSQLSDEDIMSGKIKLKG